MQINTNRKFILLRKVGRIWGAEVWNPKIMKKQVNRKL